EGLLQGILLQLPVTVPTAQKPGQQHDDNQNDNDAEALEHGVQFRNSKEGPRPSLAPPARQDNPLSSGLPAGHWPDQAVARAGARLRWMSMAITANAIPARSVHKPPSMVSRAADTSSSRTRIGADDRANQPSTPADSRYTPKVAVISARAISNHPPSINRALL